MSEFIQKIIYCNGCNQPKIICACLGQAGEPAASNNDKQPSRSATELLFEKLILNAYQALNKEKLSAGESNSDSDAGISQAQMVILTSLEKITSLQFKFEKPPLDKLVELLEHLKSNVLHPDVVYQIEKVENQLRNYLQAHPDKMRPELSYLFEKQENKLSVKNTPFKTKLSPLNYSG
ncbi:MAG: hypothetical protein WC748_04680 [Legionellales bacterium]|jgi:hypothetical protein